MKSPESISPYLETTDETSSSPEINEQIESTSEIVSAEPNIWQTMLADFQRHLTYIPEDTHRGEDEYDHYRQQCAEIIQNSLDYTKYPDEIQPRNLENDDERIVWQKIDKLQEFAGIFVENSYAEGQTSHSLHLDERLKLGQEYSQLLNRRRRRYEGALDIQDRPDALERNRLGFTEDLSALLIRYANREEDWKNFGQNTLNSALNNYADAFGDTDGEATATELQNLIPPTDEIDIYSIRPAVEKVNQAVRQTWVENITPLNEFDKDQPYSLICHKITHQPFKAQEYYGNVFSCSLITQDSQNFYAQNRAFNYGFIFPADHIIAASKRDLQIDNQATDDYFLSKITAPLIEPYETVRESLKVNKEITEIVTRDQPIGIFVVDEPSSKTPGAMEDLRKLSELNPHLNIYTLPPVKEEDIP